MCLAQSLLNVFILSHLQNERMTPSVRTHSVICFNGQPSHVAVPILMEYMVCYFIQLSQQSTLVQPLNHMRPLVLR